MEKIIMKCLLSALSLFYLFGAAPLVYADTKVYFSPDGGCQEAVMRQISEARRTIDIAMYDLTSRKMSRQLIKARERGVKIRVFLDQGEAGGKYSKGRYLMAQGMDVRFYTGTGLMHNKFAVIDNRVLITGSFNWTASAERENQENLLIITDENVVRQYAQKFETLWAGPQDKPVIKNGPINVRVSGDVTMGVINRTGLGKF